DAGNSNPLTVTLNVNDLDESAPTITSSATAAAIDENSGSDQWVYSAMATDLGDISGGVTLSLSGTHASDFDFDPATGKLVLTEDPDYETTPLYQFTITATDAAGHATHKNVTLAVNDLDEIPPVASLQLVPAPQYALGDEITVTSSEAGTLYLVNDSIDVTSLASITQADATLWKTAPLATANQGVGIDTTGLDVGTYYAYALDEAGNLSLASSESVDLIDATPPVFTSGEEATAVNENGSEVEVYTITTDEEATYSLSGADRAFFTLDEGVVSFIGGADFETKDSYTFTVTATDIWGNDSTHNVTMAVNDLEEIPPTASIAETTAILEALGNNTGEDVWPQVIALGTLGEFAIAWSGIDSDGDASIFVQLFNSDGSQNGEAQQLEALYYDGGDDLAPQLAAIGDQGDFVVVWTGRESSSSAESTIYVQVFHADGTLNGEAQPLEAFHSPGSVDDLPQVAAIGTQGAFVVTWQGQDSSGDESIFVQVFDENGALSGSTQKLEALNNSTGDDSNPQITAVGSGAFIVTWSGVDTDGDSSIFVQLFDASGNLQGTTQQLEALKYTLGDDQSPQITAIGNQGAFAVTWYGGGRDGDDNVYVQRFAADGTPAGNTHKLEAAGNEQGNDLIPQIAAVGTDGAYIVTWCGIDSEGDSSIFIQAFNADGTVNGATHQLEGTGTPGGNDVGPQIITVGSDNSYVITWSCTDSDGDSSIFVQRFNANGTFNGATEQLEAPDNAAGNDINPQITALGDQGAFVVTWSGADNDGDSSVYAQLYQADGTQVLTGATYPIGYGVSLSSTEAGDVYLVSSTLIVTELEDITQASEALWSRAALNTDGGAVAVNTDDLEVGTYYAYAVDGAGNLSLASSQSIRLVDRTAPVFTSSTSATSVDENGGSLVVYSITTDDPEATYALSGTDSGSFVLNADDTVSFVGGANHESKSTYRFTITATDAVGNASTQEVTMRVTDLDESAPAVVTQVVPVYSEMGDLNLAYATNQDTVDLVAGVTYQIDLEGYDSGDGTLDDPTLLGIRDPNGNLIANTSNDDASSETLNAQVTFTATETGTYTILIGGYNDETGTYRLSVSPTAGFTEELVFNRNIPLTEVIYTAVGADTADIDNNTDTSDQLTFDLTGADADSFAINANGEVRFVETPANATQSSYEFSVVAIDAAGNVSEAGPIIRVTLSTSVMIDLVNGNSSLDYDADRTFNADETYSIYMLVDSDSESLSLATDQRWSGVENLGSDDRIILVGDDGAVLSSTSASTAVFNSVEETGTGDDLVWGSSAAESSFVLDGAQVTRYEGGDSISLNWATSATDWAENSSPNEGLDVSVVTLNALPTSV
ncbi:MAG: hypothetical protein ACPGYX_04330, partial [Oceanobacter sp.]